MIKVYCEFPLIRIQFLDPNPDPDVKGPIVDIITNFLLNFKFFLKKRGNAYFSRMPLPYPVIWRLSKLYGNFGYSYAQVECGSSNLLLKTFSSGT